MHSTHKHTPTAQGQLTVWSPGSSFKCCGFNVWQAVFTMELQLQESKNKLIAFGLWWEIYFHPGTRTYFYVEVNLKPNVQRQYRGTESEIRIHVYLQLFRSHLCWKNLLCTQLLLFMFSFYLLNLIICCWNRTTPRVCFRKHTCRRSDVGQYFIELDPVWVFLCPLMWFIGELGTILSPFDSLPLLQACMLS